MELVKTPHGTVPTENIVERGADGVVLGCLPAGACVLETSIGVLTPQFTTDDLRKKEVLPLVFHGSGHLKACPLETQTMVKTPCGLFPAELVTFFPSGDVSRVFPLNGRLSGYWTQEDEAKLAGPMRLPTPIGDLEGRVISISFYASGDLRSITFWPGECVTIPTSCGPVETRVGVCFHPGGQVRSVEPAKPTPVKTPIGEIMAFDSDTVGISGDLNSLSFDEDGHLLGLATSLSRVVVSNNDSSCQYAPEYRESLCGDEEQEITPMLIAFESDALVIRKNPEAFGVRIPLTAEIRTAPFLPQLSRPLGDLRCSM